MEMERDSLIECLSRRGRGYFGTFHTVTVPVSGRLSRQMKVVVERRRTTCYHFIHLRLAAILEMQLTISALCLSAPHMLWRKEGRGQEALQLLLQVSYFMLAMTNVTPPSLSPLRRSRSRVMIQRSGQTRTGQQEHFQDCFQNQRKSIIHNSI